MSPGRTTHYSSGGGGNNQHSSNQHSMYYSSYHPTKQVDHLDTIDSDGPLIMDDDEVPAAAQQPSNNSSAAGGTWDTETDHILSYFLDGGDGSSLSHSDRIPTADFASTKPSPSSSSFGPNNNCGNDGSESGGDGSGGGSGGAWLGMPPPTPAVQFYSHTPQPQPQPPHHHGSSKNNIATTTSGNNKAGTRHVQNNPNSGGSPSQQYLLTSTSQSSSSSSLSSMAAALMNGGNPAVAGFPMYGSTWPGAGGGGLMPTNGPASSEQSPISPAALIGSEHENLLLPPPPSSGNNSCGGAEAADTVRRNAMPSTQDVSSSMGPPEPREPKIYDVPRPPPHAMMPPLLPAHSQTTILPTPGGNAGAAAMQLPNGGMVMVPTTAAAAAHHAQLLYATTFRHHHHQQQRSTEPESEEKRAKRLERNRESARKSRRRKKERLMSLGAQVNRLHGRLETARREQINLMVPGLQKSRTVEIRELLQQQQQQQVAASSELQERLAATVHGSGPSSALMRSVVDFQYTTLKQMTLPTYHKMLLWLTLQNEKFFMAGKEEYITKMQGKSALPSPSSSRASTPKFSSKQIGEEIFNNAVVKEKSSKKKRDKDGNETESRLTAASSDAVRMWPLFCYELKFSVDQEDRFVTTHKEISEGRTLGSQDLPNRRSQMAAAVATTDSMGKAVGCLSHRISKREEKSLLEILNPQQVGAYQEWLSNNRDHCRRLVSSRHDTSSDAVASSPDKGASLEYICKRLNEVLRISSGIPNDQMSEGY